ncbi:ABC transporter ATP-binding protein [Hymenobacter sp. HDW8]|uniref:ABC transporter ATP-binding protein n=1 Tax=Hymenobacter sp. HDW8 TaxID=2714932 RepID=UPI00140CDB36|nr:ATP-binding cassette domain-containing protein [Hymenobacter sp. HDW8]QIL74567.1 ATP-binding cassette domain-containing protein [Hymenobacter sp. HDW8]
MSIAPPVIRVRDLSKHYPGHAAVQNISFDLAAGETLVLLGPSGCGKTTLLKMLNRLIEPTAGTVEINGVAVDRQQPEVLRRGIGYVIQQVGLLPHYTVAENIGVVPRLLGHAPTAIAERTDMLLTRLHLPPKRFAGQYPHQLSGGQQQRVGLARALAADPPIMLLDEPFGALDPVTRAGIRREFRELEELRSKTMVLVTHDVTEAFELADRIALLDGGQMQQLGTPHELLFQPANNFVRDFFAAERLALQLRTLRLRDLLPFLPTSAKKTPSNKLIFEKINNSLSIDKPISYNHSVQEALELLTEPRADGVPSNREAAEDEARYLIMVESDEKAPQYRIDLPQLMAAFAQAIHQAETTWKS